MSQYGEQTPQPYYDALERFFHVSPKGFAILDEDCCFQVVNTSGQKLLDRSEIEFCQLSLFDLLHPHDIVPFLKATGIGPSRDDGCTVSTRFPDKKGRYSWLKWEMNFNCNSRTWLVLITGIEDLKKSEFTSDELTVFAKLLFKGASYHTWRWRKRTGLVEFSSLDLKADAEAAYTVSQLLRMVNRRDRRRIVKTLRVFESNTADINVDRNFEEIFSTGLSIDRDWRLRGAVTERDSWGMAEAAIGVIWNVAEQFEQLESLAHASTPISATGLPTRREFLSIVARLLSTKAETNYVRGFALLGIKDFELLVRSFGRSTASNLLADIAECMSNETGLQMSFSGHIGEDRIAVFLQHDDATEMEARLQAIFAEATASFDRHLIEGHAGLVMGAILRSANDMTWVDSALVEAEQALMTAKLEGSAQIVIYDEADHTGAVH